jgi:hypothetical protein
LAVTVCAGGAGFGGVTVRSVLQPHAAAHESSQHPGHLASEETP